MSTNKDVVELQDITTEEPSKPASERASDTESATSKEPENQGSDPKSKNVYFPKSETRTL